MCSRFLSAVVLMLAGAGVYAAPTLRVCADPNNLPFSNRQEQGFDNRVAQVVARELGMRVQFEWQRMGRGFVRDILNKRACDVLLGAPSNFAPGLTTEPYYRSSYVFITRRDRRLHLQSFDDPRLQTMKIGVQVLSEDYAPPAVALGRRGLVSHIVGFETTGAHAGDIVNAVARGQIDAAVVWGPLAGYYARRHASELEITPAPEADPPGLPLAYSISFAVRKNDTALRDQLNAGLKRGQREIARILNAYGVPQLPLRSAGVGD